jgi:hypothetical protein
MRSRSILAALILALALDLDATPIHAAPAGVLLLDGVPQPCPEAWPVTEWPVPDGARLFGLHVWQNTDRPGLVTIGATVELLAPDQAPVELAAELAVGLASTYRAWPELAVPASSRVRITVASGGPADARCAVRVLLHFLPPSSVILTR